MRLPQDAACLVLGAMLSVGAWGPASPAPRPGRGEARPPVLPCAQYVDTSSAWTPVRWESLTDDLTGIPLYTVQAGRLATENTAICNYVLQR